MILKLVEPADPSAWAGALERRLNVRKRARADGQAGAPAVDADDWSPAERDILVAVDAARHGLEAERAELGARTEAELRTLASEPADIDAPVAAARLDLKQIAGRFAADIATLRAQANEARAHLNAFKERHSLHRPAIYPSSAVLQAGLLMLAATFEALFSAALFAETEARGLLGGAVIALGLSAANVTLGFLAGLLGLRYLGHAHAALRIAGALAFTLALALAAALNLFAAAWRNQIALSSVTARDTLDPAMLFGLSAPQAVILLMLGAGVWVFAALKGYSGLDDPYPDYGKLDRAARDREEQLSALREEAREEMAQALERARAQIDGEVDHVRAALAPMRRAYDQGAGALADKDARLRRICEAGNELIQLYRRENLAARDGAAPRYFAQPPPFAGPAENPLARAADLLLEARRIAEDVHARASASLTALSDEAERAAAFLEPAAPPS